MGRCIRCSADCADDIFCRDCAAERAKVFNEGRGSNFTLHHDGHESACTLEVRPDGIHFDPHHLPNWNVPWEDALELAAWIVRECAAHGRAEEQK